MTARESGLVKNGNEERWNSFSVCLAWLFFRSWFYISKCAPFSPYSYSTRVIAPLNLGSQSLELLLMTESDLNFKFPTVGRASSPTSKSDVLRICFFFRQKSIEYKVYVRCRTWTSPSVTKCSIKNQLIHKLMMLPLSHVPATFDWRGRPRLNHRLFIGSQKEVNSIHQRQQQKLSLEFPGTSSDSNVVWCPFNYNVDVLLHWKCQLLLPLISAINRTTWEVSLWCWHGAERERRTKKVCGCCMQFIFYYKCM